MSDEIAPGLCDSDFAEPRTVVHLSIVLSRMEESLPGVSLAACGWGQSDPDDLISRREFLNDHQFTSKRRSVTCHNCRVAMVEQVLLSMPGL